MAGVVRRRGGAVAGEVCKGGAGGVCVVCVWWVAVGKGTHIRNIDGF